MAIFQPTDIDAAPERSKPVLKELKETYGFVPKNYRILAHSPQTLKAYTTLGKIFDGTSLQPEERMLVVIAVSAENGASQGASAHSTVAKSQLRMDPALVDAAVDGKTLSDERLNALVEVVREIVRERGKLNQETVDNFFAQGYTKEQLMEIYVGVAAETIPSYLSHISEMPPDDELQDDRPASV